MIDPRIVCKSCMRKMGGYVRICPYCHNDNGIVKNEDPQRLAPGTILLDKYLIGPCRAQGGFGITYKAYDLKNDLTIAIKEYFPTGLVTRNVTLTGNDLIVASDRQSREIYGRGLKHFEVEANTLAQFNALPSIVTARSFFKTNNTAYLVMDYVDGMSLKEYLKWYQNENPRNPQGNPIQYQTVLRLMYPVMQSLESVHNIGLIHRDISPDNIMVERNGKVTLIDFGAARPEMPENMDSSTSIVVKRGYAPEEQYRVNGNQGPWTDVYALCATMYRMISGRKPMESMERLKKDELVPLKKWNLAEPVPPKVSDVIQKGLSVEAKYRYPSMKALYAAFEKAMPGMQNQMGYGSYDHLDVENEDLVRRVWGDRRGGTVPLFPPRDPKKGKPGYGSYERNDSGSGSGYPGGGTSGNPYNVQGSETLRNPYRGHGGGSGYPGGGTSGNPYQGPGGGSGYPGGGTSGNPYQGPGGGSGYPGGGTSGNPYQGHGGGSGYPGGGTGGNPYHGPGGGSYPGGGNNGNGNHGQGGSSNKGNKKKRKWIRIVILAAVIAAAGIVTGILLKKKAGPSVDSASLYPDGQGALGGYVSASYNSAVPEWSSYGELLDRVRDSTEADERLALMHEAEDLVMGTGAVIPLCYYNNAWLLKPDITGVYSDIFPHEYLMFADGSEGELKACISTSFDSLDPAESDYRGDSGSVLVNLYEGMFRYEADGLLHNALCESYETSQDGKTYNFRLREGLLWSDGSPLTAGDFENSWKRASKGKYASVFEVIARDTQGELQVSAIDDRTLIVTLTDRRPSFLYLCATAPYYPVRMDNEEYFGSSWGKDSGNVSEMVFNGAFRIDSWSKDEMVLQKNTSYYRASEVKLDQVRLYPCESKDEIYALYQAGDLDMTTCFPTGEIANLYEKEDYHTADQNGLYLFCFNVNSDIFSGKTLEEAILMRKALSVLTDRENIVKNCTKKYQKTAVSFIPPGISDGKSGFFKENTEQYTYPVEETAGYLHEYPDGIGKDTVSGVRDLMKEAGFSFDGKGELKEELKMVCLVPDDTMTPQRCAESLSKDFEKIGAVLEVKVVSPEEFDALKKQGEYDLVWSSWSADYSDPYSLLYKMRPADTNACRLGIED